MVTQKTPVKSKGSDPLVKFARRLVLILLVISAGVGCDQMTKSVAQRTSSSREEAPFSCLTKFSGQEVILRGFTKG